MQALTPEDVRRALDATPFEFEILHCDEPTPTSADAARVIGCEVGQIAKSICFLVAGEPVLVVTSGDQQVDDRKIAAMYEVGRKKVKLAKPDECIAIYGYAPGGVPPLGHRTPNIRIFLDVMLKRYPVVYAAAGSAHDNFGLTIPQLEQVTSGTWADVARD